MRDDQKPMRDELEPMRDENKVLSAEISFSHPSSLNGL
jgi:hypothetical protein